ncbi:MAG: D-glycero-beta-D-manno-heptose 1-phosphate adenylyltransferase [candidate division Zixibacteria bacterium]|nr:D-glycero-beta-D-manno-heptose 1-phosphate adenylyltransferase [candidate division Zixibacteria bacterium]
MSHKKIKGLKELVEIREKLKRQAKTVVFTNGCFDVLHRGHIECLRKAKSYGDMLFVGLNSDSSVRKIKGQGRPIFPQDDRAEILASLEIVDYVVIFNEETPQKVIAALVPDVLVKGADYRKNEIVGRGIVESSGGRVVRVRQIPGKSTKNLIRKIIGRYAKS